MTQTAQTPLPDLAQALQKAIRGEVRFDFQTRLLYSTDASIYQIEPLGVVFPRTLDELTAAVEIAASFDVPILPRGSGSSLAGQAIGAALIVDCSRYLNRILEIDPERGTALVEPGVILTRLNREAARFELQFGPDPASAERATLGGSIGNNASGAHSILYGMCADHLLSAEVVLADGSLADFQTVSLEEAARRAGAGDTIESNLYRAALEIRDRCAGEIQKRWPRTWRSASGYALNYLLPWAASRPPQWSLTSAEVMGGRQRSNWGGAALADYPPVPAGSLNLAPLLAGSEGTLAVIRKARLRLVPLPGRTVLGVLAYPSLGEACDVVPSLLERGPSAVELIPRSMIQLARSVPAYASQLSILDSLRVDGEDPAALLVVEFSGEQVEALREKARSLGEGVFVADEPAVQRQIWGVRKVGLGILMSRPGDIKPAAFIEDLSVPVERLGEFVREMERILAAHGTRGDMYAHASAGCLHIRPLLNLKSSEGVKALRGIASEAVALSIRLGGSVSGEHGDGLARTEWLESLFGGEITSAFRQLKLAADPKGLLNPGKIVPLADTSLDANLRYEPGYHTETWETVLDFSRQGGLAGAIEMCNGAGVCRKEDGVMCPSFQASQDEYLSTRGRSNLLRAMISGRFPSHQLSEKTLYETLSLCLACKGCKAECPSAVDVAKLKYEFMNRYYQSHRRRLSDYLFGNIDTLAHLGHFVAPLANLVFRAKQVPALGRAVERLFGLAQRRPLPSLALRSFRSLARKNLAALPADAADPVFFLSDAFTEYFQPQVGLAAVRALETVGCRVQILPVTGAGRTLISKGFLEAGKRHAARLLEAVQRLDPEGRIPVVGVEPSEILTLRDEYLDLFPGDLSVTSLAERAYMVDEFLVRPDAAGSLRVSRLASRRSGDGAQKREVLLHGHCYQKAQPPAADGYPTGVPATVRMLEAVGYRVAVIDAGCCGMAGAFGYEADHFEMSMKVAEMRLLPAVRAAGDDVIVAASGVSCMEQIKDGAKRAAVHPVTLV